MALIFGFFERYTGSNVLLCETLSDFITVIATITDVFFCFLRKICQKNICSLEVTDLNCCQMQLDQLALTVTYGMEFRVQAAQ